MIHTGQEIFFYDLALCERVINYSFFHCFRLEHRHNIVLMGDSLGDLQMADGVENVENLLKIGFLNSHIEERLDQYLSHYDVVLIDDQTMDVPNRIIDKVLSGQR